MCRLLSPVPCWSYTSRRRGRTPVAIPAAPADFQLFSPLPDRGAGALPQFRPSPIFDGGEPRWHLR